MYHLEKEMLDYDRGWSSGMSSYAEMDITFEPQIQEKFDDIIKTVL